MAHIWQKNRHLLNITFTYVDRRPKNFQPHTFLWSCLQPGKQRLLWEKHIFYIFTKYPEMKGDLLRVKPSLYSVRQCDYGKKKKHPHCLIRSLKRTNASWKLFPFCLRHKMRQWKQSGNIEMARICFFSKIIGPFIFLFLRQRQLIWRQNFLN